MDVSLPPQKTAAQVENKKFEQKQDKENQKWTRLNPRIDWKKGRNFIQFAAVPDGCVLLLADDVFWKWNSNFNFSSLHRTNRFPFWFSFKNFESFCLWWNL